MNEISGAPAPRTLEPVTVSEEPPEIEVEPDLGWLLAQVLAFGIPVYFGHDRGTWSAKVQVPTDRPGVRADVHSGHGHPTLTAALEALLERLR